MTTNDTIITAEKLAKRFSVKNTVVDAVRGLDLEVARGELLAFLGPNGAGKSTSLRMLTTLLRPTSGTARVAGHDVLVDPAGVRRSIGYIGQGTSGGSNQRVRDELLSQGAFYGMGRAETVRRADELLDSLDLGSFAKRPVLGLSGGQKRRLDIALGLIHAPALLFLDEPSTGLDPQSRANLWRHLLELREQHGTTLFVTTHYLDEADQFAERVLVMDHGAVIADDDAPALKSTLAGDVITVGFGSAADASRARAVAAPFAVRPLESATSGSDGVNASGAESAPGSAVGGARLELVVDRGERALPALLRALDESGTPAETATLRQPTLDDVFLTLTGRSLRDGGAGAPTESTERISA